MKFTSFEQLERYILKCGIVKRIVLCGAHDSHALSALVKAKRKGLVAGILIGDEAKIKALLSEMNEDAADYSIIHEPEETLSAPLAVTMVKQGKADIPMKGLMQTASYMRAILNKETGILPTGAILSETTVFEYPDQSRMVFITDCAVNINPNVEEKVKLIENASTLAHRFGIQRVRVAAVSALEKPTPKISSTLEASALASLTWPEDIIVEGPFALDNAISELAAQHKGLQSEVSGHADVLLMPDLCSGNILHKGLHYFAHLKMAGALCGTEHPVIMNSRTDSPDTKYNSILVAVLQSL